MRHLIYYFSGLISDFRDNLSPRLPSAAEFIALLVLLAMVIVLLADKYLARYISEKIIRDVGVYIIFTLAGIMGIIFIITKEIPFFLVRVRGTSAIIIGVLLAISSFWLLFSGLIIDVQKILNH